MEKYALITGGSKGIGRAIAYNLGKAGYNLILTYASDDQVAEKECQLLAEQYTIAAYPVKADITDRESIDNIHKFLVQKELKLDALVFNAGITCRDSFESLSIDKWEEVFFANVHFPVFLLQQILPCIKPEGSVVFTGSLMGVHPHSVSLPYGVTKSAVHSLVKNLVKFLKPYKIRVNGVAPGFVDTEWQKTKPAEIRKNIENKLSLERFCEPEEVAEVYKMLIENSYLNDEIIVIDGGYSYK